VDQQTFDFLASFSFSWSISVCIRASSS